MPEKNVLYATFEDLCVEALSASDYKAICEQFETLYIARIPRLNVVDDRNAVTRLVKLVDTAYDYNVKLIVSTQVSVGSLFEGARGDVVSEEAFAVGRAVSRLTEMESDDYRKRPWKSRTIENMAEPCDAAA